VLDRLAGGDRRSIGDADAVARLVATSPRLFDALIHGLWHTDPMVSMRAADAAEKITRRAPELLQPYKKELLGLLSEATQQELRWHLAVMIPRLSLNGKELRRAGGILCSYLVDRSSIVRTFALQGLADLARQEPSMRPAVVELLREAVRGGSPAMKARSRRLLSSLERD